MEQEALAKLLAGMSAREKLGQLLQLTPEYFGQAGTAELTGPQGVSPLADQDCGYVGSVLNCTGAAQARSIQQEHLRRDRNRIPLLFMADVIHGYRTIFPIPLAMACSFSPEDVRQAARIAAAESAVSGIHVTFSPMADLVRDPRWGRVMESSGEDPLLNSRMTAAMVQGYWQADSENPGRVVACVKHFAAYGAPEGGREYNNAELSSSTLEEYYLPGYHAALKAGASMVMAAFQTVDHVPATANVPLLRGILRERWGFDGVVISDYNAVDELINHGVASDGKAAAARALAAGVDIEMMSTHYLDHGEALLDAGILSEVELDAAVLRILKLKNNLGLFEDPYAGMDEMAEASRCCCEKHLLAAQKIARKCPVLLKNEGNALPLRPDEAVGLTGPFALESEVLGAWSAGQTDGVCLYDGLRARMHEGQLMVGPCGRLGSLLDGIDDIAPVSEEALRAQLALCRKVLVAVGENQNDTGEGASKTNLRLSPRQEGLIHALKAMGKTVIAVVFSGRPLELQPVLQDCDAVLQAWFLGTESGNVLADLLLGITSPQGKLAMTFPRTVGQIPVYYSQLRTGRPVRQGVNTRYASRYLDCPNDPLYPFGFGLTYGRCRLSTLEVNERQARVKLSNTGGREAVETVQLYVVQRTAQIARPVRQLRDFQQVTVAPGESVWLHFDLTQEMFCYPYKGHHIFEPGIFTIMVGLDSAHVLSKDREITKACFDALRKESL